MFKSIQKELRRMWPLLTIALLSVFLLGDHAQFVVQLYRLSMASMVIMAAHLIRSALFPYLDLSEIVDRAGDSPIGSGLVWIGMVALLVAIIMASMVGG